ncbi:MAG: substrate-binding domain-containing protein [Hyphomicrobiales bacterium]
MRISLGRVALAIAAFFVSLQLAAAADIKVLTTPALREVWHDLQPKFEANGHKLIISYAASGLITKRVSEGEVFDVLFSTTSSIDTLTKDGKVITGTGTPLASSATGVAVLKGSPKPDISTPDAFKKALLAAKAVAYTDPASGGASGAHMAKVFEQLGITAEINAKAKLARGIPSASFIVKGEAEIAIQQMPELLGVEGVEVVGPLPGDLQSVTPFAGGVHVNATNPDAAKALIKFLQSPEAVAVIKARGLDPIPPPAPPKAS